MVYKAIQLVVCNQIENWYLLAKCDFHMENVKPKDFPSPSHFAHLDYLASMRILFCSLSQKYITRKKIAENVMYKYTVRAHAQMLIHMLAFG